MEARPIAEITTNFVLGVFIIYPGLTKNSLIGKRKKAAWKRVRLVTSVLVSSVCQRRDEIACGLSLRDWLRSLWFFAYSVQGGPGQPFPGFLSQLGGAMKRELFLDAHLACPNRFDAYIQFTR